MFVNIRNVFHVLKKSLSSEQLLNFYFLLIFGVFITAFEVFSIALLAPIMEFFAIEAGVIKSSSLSILSDDRLYDFIAKIGLWSFLAVLCSSYLLRIMHMWWKFKFINSVEANIGNRLFSNILHFKFELYQKQFTDSAIQTLVYRGRRVAIHFCIPIVDFFVSSIFIVLLVSVLLFLSEPAFIFFGGMIGAIYLCIVLLTGRIFWKAGKITNVASQEILSNSKAMVEHIADAKFLLNKHALIDNDFKYRRSYCDSRTKIEFFTGLPRLAIELFLITAVFAAFVFAVKNFSGEIILSAIPQVFLFIIAAQKSIPVLQRIFACFSTIKSELPSIEELVPFLADRGPNFEVPLTYGSTHLLEAVDLSYNYAGKTPLFKSISFELKKGVNLAITGESGVGKSTLLKILSGLISDFQGQVKYNAGFDGRPYSDFISYVGQDSVFFNGSILQNLTGFAESIDSEKVDKLIDMCELRGLISNLPEGIDTRISASSTELSGGEKQRLALARALYKSPEIIVLDEFSSALDNRNKQKILNLLFCHADGSSIIFSTHDLRQLKFADKHLKMTEGSCTWEK